MKQSLNLKLAQQLTLTPQLKQSLRLLQLSSLDLENEIQQALDSNPLLERLENEKQAEKNKNHLSDESSAPSITEAADPNYEIERADHLPPEQDLSTEWQESFNVQRSNAPVIRSEEVEFTHFVSKEETLVEHLSWQVQMTTLSDKDKLIAQTLIHSLNDEGYLTLGLDEVCQMIDANLEVEADEIAAVLSLIKTLDPIGVGASNLSERLQILLEQLPKNTHGIEIAALIVSEHLDLLGTRNLTKLKREVSSSDDELAKALSLITNLNPRITTQYQSDNENYITPDLIISKNQDNHTWVAKINTENQTKLHINETYSRLLKSNIDKQGSEFIQHNLLEAKTFIKSLMSRYDTLLLVGQVIVERQQAFFEHGAEHMQPMVLQDIANELEMHESTISRATAGKYLLSPRGVVELKYFFSSAIAKTDGATSSSIAIRSLIKKVVDAESKKKPLSDAKIAKELEQQGHIVARRTVAKYRESMNIAPSSLRKSLV